MRLTIDSNILVYAVDADTPGKHAIATDLMVRAVATDTLLTVQALAEFLAVIGRRYPVHFKAACMQADRWAKNFPMIPASWVHVSAAVAFAARHRLPFWDSVIWQTARSAGATLFLSEDLQDGLSLEGMTVLDPFNPANTGRLDRLLGEAPSRP